MMSIFVFLLYTVEVLVSLLLVVAILVQRTKSQGMGLALGSGMGEAMFGSQAGNVMTRATVILAIIFMANTTALALIGTNRKERSVVDSAAAAETAVPLGIPEQVPMAAPGPGSADGFTPLNSAPIPVSIPEGAPVSAPATDVPLPATDAPAAE